MLKSKTKIKSINIELTDYRGFKKYVKLEPEQIKEINSQYTVKESIKRLKSACMNYSKDYWVTGYMNNHKIAQYQWAEL